MEEQQAPQPLPAAPYPGPPPFWKHFTIANLEKLKDIQVQASTELPNTDESIQERQPSSKSLPSELTYLIPPPPPHPSNPSYPAFLTQIPLSPDPRPLDPSLALFATSSQNLTPVLPSLLTRLTKSILLNFLELSTLLSTPTAPPTDPDAPLWKSKIADLESLFTNAIYCVNLYRPHQAREEVIGLLEVELEKAEEEIKRLDGVGRRIEGFLGEMETRAGGSDDCERTLEDFYIDRAADGKTQKDQEVQHARRLWKAIREVEDD